MALSGLFFIKRRSQPPSPSGLGGWHKKRTTYLFFVSFSLLVCFPKLYLENIILRRSFSINHFCQYFSITITFLNVFLDSRRLVYYKVRQAGYHGLSEYHIRTFDRIRKFPAMAILVIFIFSGLYDQYLFRIRFWPVVPNYSSKSGTDGWWRWW